jgi:dephospho-CoA kinase
VTRGDGDRDSGDTSGNSSNSGDGGAGGDGGTARGTGSAATVEKGSEKGTEVHSEVPSHDPDPSRDAITPREAAVRVIGVAGTCCAGKDQVTAWLLQRGWEEINVDRIGHDALAANHARIVAAFGPTILDDRGTIDRRSLGAVVFSDPHQLQRLESIVHPWMRNAVETEIAAWRAEDTSSPPCPRGLVINAAILFHMGLHEFCDTIVLVTAPLLARIRRARTRDGLGYWAIFRRLWTQRHLNAQARAATAETITVENGRSLESLYRQLDEHPQLQ